MNNKILTVLGVIVGVGLLVFIYVVNTQNSPGAKNSEVPKVPTTAKSLVKETIPETKPGPGLTRHVFNGDIKTITADGQGQKIVLKNENMLTVPDFVVTAKVRIWKKVGGQFVKAETSDIKANSQVDLHLDKDDKQGFWIFRDVYVLK